MWWLPALVLAVGLVFVVVVGRALVGGVLLGSAFVLAAALRLVLPPDRAGGLVVRSRGLDVLMWLGLAALVVGAFFAVDLRPLRMR